MTCTARRGGPGPAAAADDGRRRHARRRRATSGSGSPSRTATASRYSAQGRAGPGRIHRRAPRFSTRDPNSPTASRRPCRAWLLPAGQDYRRACLPGGQVGRPSGHAKPGNPESSQLRFRIPRPSPRRGPTHRGPGPVTGQRGRWHFASRTERLISTPGSGGLDIALCARSCVLAWSRGDADVRRGAPAYGGTPGSGKIVEDLASAEDPVPDS
jgi:hypothetical protein